MPRSRPRPRRFRPGAALPGHQRARYLYALARLIQRHSRLFAVVEALDNGKPIRESARHRRAAGRPAFLSSRRLGAAHGQRSWRSCEPVGVCGQIIPWNFPLLMLAWKIAPAIALGNTVVLKPAEYTSVDGAALRRHLPARPACRRASSTSSPATASTGEALVKPSRRSTKIAFTGSTEVGRIIREATAGSGKSLTLELGGKSPFIIFDDADLDAAVEGVVDAIWFNQGQVCCAGSRLLVQEGIHDRFVAQAAWRGWRSCASATRSTRRSTWVRSCIRCSWSASGRWSRSRR